MTHAHELVKWELLSATSISSTSETAQLLSSLHFPHMKVLLFKSNRNLFILSDALFVSSLPHSSEIICPTSATYFTLAGSLAICGFPQN